MKKVMSEINGAVFSLHCYVAKDECFFASEGIDVQFVEAHAVTPKHNTDNPEEVNPILGHVTFEDQRDLLSRTRAHRR